jgi:hypothetical protein
MVDAISAATRTIRIASRHAANTTMDGLQVGDPMLAHSSE